MWPTTASDGPSAVPGTRTHELPRTLDETSPTGRGGLAPHGGGGVFLARRTGRGQQAFEQLGKGHGREDTTGAFRATPR